MVKMEPNYRVRFADGSVLDVSSDLARMVPQLEAMEPGVAPRYYAFLRDSGLKYRYGRHEFVEKNFLKAADFFTARNLRLLNALGATKKLYPHVGRYFRDPRLRQVFSMQSMYLGISPYEAPAVYTLLSYTELAEDGLWFTMGGTYALPRAMAALAEEKGVRIHTDAPVSRIVVEGGRAKGIEVAGSLAPADVVLSNADLPYTYLDLLPPEARGPWTQPKLDRLAYTASAFMMYLGTDRRYDHLLHHNFFLGRDYRANFDAIFRTKTLPEDPSFYVNCPAHTDPSLSPPGGENLFVLVPIPHLSPQVDWTREKERYTEKMYRLLEERAGLMELGKHVVVEHIYTPHEWRDRFNLRHGAAFGLSHGMRQVGYFRPANRCPAVSNLYFVGASTTPGTGLPLVTIGARLVTERIFAEQKA
jgi:phytoene desaturase